jgi:GNAT superfamily N-acetyltransferase
MATALQHPGAPLVRRLRRRDRGAALAYLARAPAENLMMLDTVARLGSLRPGAPGAGTLIGAFAGGALCGVLSVRPSVLLDAAATPEAVAALAPSLAGVGAGLIRSPAGPVDELWAHLERAGRHAVVDRREIAQRLDLAPASVAALPEGPSVRAARAGDLEDLVVAARASLREEGRPDPFDGDPEGFRAWVHGRMGRAHVIEEDGRVVFVAYADVQRREGWLLQGVYTWPDRRRRGFARAGVARRARRPARAGATHVQLAVVADNEPALRLYAGLGFRPFLDLRTILFH